MRAVLAALFWLAGAGPAAAHAFAERYELPVPVWLFIVGGALTVTVTFVMVGVFARGGAERYAACRVRLSEGTPAGLRRLLQIAGVAALLLILAAGFAGDPSPHRNIVPTLVWIVGWVGFSYLAMLIGNPWPAVDPWRTLFDRFGPSVRAPRPWPRRLGAWPALILLLLFGWFELVFPFAAQPRILASLIAAYSLLAWAIMALYGPDAWRDSADPFHRVFGLFGRFAPLAREEVGLVLRPYAARLLGPGTAVSTPVSCFIVGMLAIVLFDGLQGSAHWTAIEDAVHALNPRLGDVGWILVHTAGLLLTWLLLLGLFLGTCALMRRIVGGEHTTLDYARAFALTLIPIAVGYHFAHTFVYLLVQGQNAISLASDPFGWGWDLFGTRGRAVDIAIINAKTAWYLALTAIVSGHAVSVYLAHDVAGRLVGTRGRAFGCLVPMTVLMVLYTVVSLQILAEPLVRYSGPQETII
ncbi:MAG: hypothetical protein FJX55_10975 [Alphaproteobacteria bacterium]|nr:hypothetical protein [Alphaproteobacteria bacterium]